MGIVFTEMPSCRPITRHFGEQDRILDQKYEERIFWDPYYEDFNFKIEENAY